MDRWSGLRQAAAAVAATCTAMVAAAGLASTPPPLRLLPGQHPYAAVADRTTVGFLLYAPAAYGREPRRRWPLIVYLHGTGEKGSDPRSLVVHVLPKTLARTTSFPAIVLSPQLPSSVAWWSDWLGPVDALVRRIEGRYRVDSRRVYLTGVSLGGFGTWSYALRYPDRFAALVPMAGGYIQGSTAVPPNLCSLRRTPIWVFHGTADTFVRPYQSQVLVRALRACGSTSVRLTLYRGLDHYATFPRAYGEPALWSWLFAQKR